MSVRRRAWRERTVLYKLDQASTIRVVTAMAEVGLQRPTLEQAEAFVTYLCNTEWAAEILQQALDAASDAEH